MFWVWWHIYSFSGIFRWFLMYKPIYTYFDFELKKIIYCDYLNYVKCSAYVCVLMPLETRRGYQLDQELEVQAIACYLMWMLGTELQLKLQIHLGVLVTILFQKI